MLWAGSQEMWAYLVLPLPPSGCVTVGRSRRVSGLGFLKLGSEVAEHWAPQGLLVLTFEDSTASWVLLGPQPDLTHPHFPPAGVEGGLWVCDTRTVAQKTQMVTQQREGRTFFASLARRSLSAFLTSPPRGSQWGKGG